MIHASYRSNTLQRKGFEGMYPRGPVENVFSTSEHSTALHRVTITGERMYSRFSIRPLHHDETLADQLRDASGRMIID